MLFLPAIPGNPYLRSAFWMPGEKACPKVLRAVSNSKAIEKRVPGDASASNAP
jgi:hypothetical protein